MTKGMDMHDASEIRKAAKQIFCATYHYPAMPLRKIGRKGFRWALNEAKRRATEAARIAAIPADVKARRIAALRDEAEGLKFKNGWRSLQARRAEIEREIAALSA
jgi:hypothetical protein